MVLALPFALTGRVSSTVSFHNNAVEEARKENKASNAKVLILGGTGRVGGSTAKALSKFRPDLYIIVAGRNKERGASLVSTLGNNSEFVEVDANNMPVLKEALEGVDLVVHAAGPFQREEKCVVLEAAISTKTAYVDVCDDTNYSWKAKSFNQKAIDAGVPAVTTGGIYPGVSNVMAAELVRAARAEDFQPERLRFCYYTAGSGGAGPTILATSLLLLGEDVVAYNNGEKIKLRPYSGVLNTDFGKGVGKKDVYLLNLPEVTSAHKILGVPTVSARFATAPFFLELGNGSITKASSCISSWNKKMEKENGCTVLPQKSFSRNFLKSKEKIKQLIPLLDPLVRAVDGIAGERVSMRIDLECANGRNTLGIFSHKRLSIAVGNATAAFALAILEGSTLPGVWFPEEPEGISIEARELLLQRASEGTNNFLMNKPPWMVETDPKEIGFGIYV